MYEDAIGLAFEHVAVSPTLRIRAVAEATRPDADSGDILAQARIKREREQAALQFARDRDLAKLEATMARLDAEAEALVARPSSVPTAAQACADRVRTAGAAATGRAPPGRYATASPRH